MRDSRKPRDYWIMQLEQDQLRIAKADNNVADVHSDERKRYRSANRSIKLRYARVLSLYSSGEAIENVANEAKDVLCHRYPDYLKSFPKTQYGPTRPAYTDIKRYLSLLVLSVPTQDEVTSFLQAYDHWDYELPPSPSCRDHVVDAMIRYLTGDDTRPLSNGIDWPEAYADLWAVLDPKTEDFGRVGALKRFIKNWYKVMSPELAAETALLDPDTTPGLYVGYWCFEAAAVAVMLGLDDDSFREHQHYPVDFADWARAQRANR